MQVSFDDERAVADAGLFLTGTLIGRLGLERLIDGKVSRGYRPGRKFRGGVDPAGGRGLHR
jgi:hypothetical protein